MLAPIFLNDEEIEQLGREPAETSQPSKTYKLDFTTGEILEDFVDNEEAIKQAAMKAIITYRDKYLIYSEDYGCEIFYLLGKAYTQEYLAIEVPRLIEEALMPDDRIESAQNFIVTKEEDSLSVSFEIVTTITDTSIPVGVKF
jgi:Protein of unknown function (DUF2634)